MDRQLIIILILILPFTCFVIGLILYYVYKEIRYGYWPNVVYLAILLAFVMGIILLSERP